MNNAQVDISLNFAYFLESSITRLEHTMYSLLNLFLFIYLTVITDCTSKQVIIASLCESIIDVLPRYPWSNSPFFAKFRKDNASSADIHSIRDWLKSLCITRYGTLLYQCVRNDFIMRNDTKGASLFDYVRPDTLSMSKLNIFDLDETLVDQRDERRPDITTTTDHDWQRIREMNARELVFGVGQDGIGLIIFRRHLMDLIDNIISSSNFIVYTYASPIAAIPRLILIEFYYNFVHRLQRLGDSEGAPNLFKFDYLITRLRTEARKSIDTVIQLVGDISNFDEIYIMDDIAWPNWVDHQDPTLRALADSGCGIYAVQLPAFEVSCSRYHLKANAIPIIKMKWFDERSLMLVINLMKSVQAYNKTQNQTHLWFKLNPIGDLSAVREFHFDA